MRSEPSDNSVLQVSVFIVLTFALSFLLLAPVLLFNKNYQDNPWFLFCKAANATPSIIGIIFILRFKVYGKTHLLKSLFSFKSIGFMPLLVLASIMPAIHVLSYLLNLLMFRENPGFSGFREMLDNPSLIGLAFISVIGAPAFEELGWRGFAYNKLKNRFGLFITSVAIGLVWAVWHYINPVNGINILSIDCAIFTLNIVLLSVIICFFFEKTNYSILAAVIVHATHNLMRTVMSPFSFSMSIIYLCLMLGAAILLLVVSNRKMFYIKEK